MADDVTTHIWIRQSAEGRKIELSLDRGEVERLLAGASLGLQYSDGDVDVDWEDTTEPLRTSGEQPGQVVTVTIHVATV